MDNDNEVVPVRENKVQLFLRDSLLSIRQDEKHTYNIEAEFEKTKKNRDFFVVGLVGAIVVVIAVGSFIVTSRINKSSRNVAVDIAVFEDINLKNVLDLAKKAEDTLETTQQERISAQANYQSELSNLQVQKRAELDILSAKKLADADRAKQRDAIVATYARRERELKSSYDLKLAEIDARLEEAKKQVESFDKKRVEEARAQKKLLDNQQDLYELERKKMQDAYEKEIAELRARNDEIQKENARLKTDQVKELIDEYQGRIAELDPTLADEKAAVYMKQADIYAAPTIPFRAVPDKIPPNFNYSAADFKEVAKGFDGLDLVLSKVESIPFENNVPAYVKSARKMAFLAGNASEAIIRSSFNRIDLERKNLAAEQAIRAEVEAALAAEQESLAAEQAARAEVEASLEASRLETETAKAETETVRVAGEDAKKVVETELEGTRAVVSGYERNLSDAARANGYDGLILSVPDPAAPVVYLVPGAADAALAGGSAIVYVYRAPKSLLGTILLTKTDSGVVATLDKVKKDLIPMDYVSIAKK